MFEWSDNLEEVTDDYLRILLGVKHESRSDHRKDHLLIILFVRLYKSELIKGRLP